MNHKRTVTLLLVAVCLVFAFLVPFYLSKREKPESVPPEAKPAPSIPSVQGPVEQAAPTIPNVQTELKQVDEVMGRTMSGSIAHSAPSSMARGETKKIEVLISPSRSPEDLEREISESGKVFSASLEITPRMKVELRPVDKDAFEVLALHDNAEQLLSNTGPTKWEWLIKANQGGSQLLILTVYRLVKYAGNNDWRLVKSYEDTIRVKVSLPQRLRGFDWKWILGILLTALLIPALWRWVDRRKESKRKP